MFVTFAGRGPERNGAAVRKWTLAQSYNVDMVAAASTTLESTFLDIVANGSGRHVAMVASNKSITPRVVKAILADKPTDEISKRLAVNPATPTAELEILVNKYGQDHAVILSKLAKNPNLSTATLLKMLPDQAYTQGGWVADETPYVEAVVNPSVPLKELLQSMKFLKEYETKLAVVKKRRKEILSYLSTNHCTNLVKPTPDTIIKTIRQLKI